MYYFHFIVKSKLEKICHKFVPEVSNKFDHLLLSNESV